LTHIDRDIYQITSNVTNIKLAEERRYYGGMVYSTVWVKN